MHDVLQHFMAIKKKKVLNNIVYINTSPSSAQKVHIESFSDEEGNPAGGGGKT